MPSRVVNLQDFKKGRWQIENMAMSCGEVLTVRDKNDVKGKCHWMILWELPHDLSIDMGFMYLDFSSSKHDV